MRSPFKSPLTLYVLWHPDYSDGASIANKLFNVFSRNVDDTFARTPGIPVYFRSFPVAADSALPRAIPFDDADHSAIIVLVDDNMVVSDEWRAYVTGLDQAASSSAGKIRLFPVAVNFNSFNFPVADTNFIRLFEVKERPPASVAAAASNPTFAERQATFLIGKLVHELSRLLYHVPRVTAEGTVQSAPPIRMFISHAKADGANVAAAIRDHIADTSLKSFFDANDIAVGYRFSSELLSALEESAIICVQTDYYATREWCLWEVINAKRLDRPVVVVNAVSNREPRSFPYLGNVPTIRWKFELAENSEQIQDVLDLTLFEVLGTRFRELFQRELIRTFELPENTEVVGHSPELFTVLKMASKARQTARTPENPLYVVYPDPPLGDEELRLLEDLAPNIHFVTPTMLPLVQHWIKNHST
ncbi:MAG TPA: toll/interleukin-1 receptor domain-containing protein [Planctomycetaceae bacterium]|nr:toll/interleukin-1 receptor domain-containing protein [Planctomycetaceae bacterium]